MLRKMSNILHAAAVAVVSGMPSVQDAQQMIPAEARRRSELDLEPTACENGGCMGSCGAPKSVGNDGCTMFNKDKATKVAFWGSVASYENPDVVHRFEHKLGLTHDEALQLFEDTKKFLFLCTTHKETLSPPPKVDDGWHHFLMFTRDYAAFCHNYLGIFMHHEPNRLGVKPTSGAQTKRAIDVAKEVFDTVSLNWGVDHALLEDRCDGSGNGCGNNGCGCTSGLKD